MAHAPVGSAPGWDAAPPPRRPVLFVNPRSGGGKAGSARLTERARERGIGTFVLHPGDDLAPVVENAVEGGADALGVAGGDGSLAVVAAAALAHGLPFICVPAGTRNHFALDLGIDRHDLIGALDAFTDGVERWIDVADVNGRIYLNNVSLGIYGIAVREPTYRDAKARTLLETTAHVLGSSAPARDMEVVDDQGRLHLDPAVVLVSNNPYSLGPPHMPGTRPRLDSGRLGVVVLDVPQPGREPGRSWTAARLEVTAPSQLHAGMDGEPVGLTPPLEFVIRPGVLRVRISSRHAGGSPWARPK